MRALSKLIAVNDPDLVLFVGAKQWRKATLELYHITKRIYFSLFLGEALVGNEAVDQLVKFNSALADHSAQNNPHLIDGIVLTKFDTIDDKVTTICIKIICRNVNIIMLDLIRSDRPFR